MLRKPLTILLALTIPAVAQLGGLGRGLGGVGNRLPGAIGGLPGTVNNVAGRLGGDLRSVTDVARDLVGRPLTAQRLLARDDRGFPIIKGEVLAVSPGEVALGQARALGFTVLRQDRLDQLNLTAVTLMAPDGMDTIAALAAMRRADPAGIYDFAHVYNASGEMTAAAGEGSEGSVSESLPDTRIGMIDGGIEKRHPALSSAAITVQAFAGKPGAPPSTHGTAVASLLVGQGEDFAGYLAGAKLFAADVFGGAPDGGSAAEIARALNWVAANHVVVTNISLAGPPNALLGAAVKSFVSTNHVLVAAVGNDGPAAPPNYPAAYPGVIAVTSVDATGHLQVDANRGGRFAARGVDVRAATLPRGYANVTGTSYAAPAIAARIARLLEETASPPVGAADQLARVSMRIDGASGPVFLMPK